MGFYDEDLSTQFRLLDNIRWLFAGVGWASLLK